MRTAVYNQLDMQVPREPYDASKRESSRFQVFEYFYYVLIFYSITNSTFGIEIPFFGTSALLALAMVCLLRRRKGIFPLFKEAQWVLLCIATFIFIEKLIYNESTSALIPVVAWTAHVIIIQSICFRPGYLLRFAFVIYAVGMIVIPFMTFHGTSERVGLSATSAISNPNNLAAWFGFCAIYFLIRTLRAKRLLDQIASAAISFSSLIIVGLTVSRGALMAIALALVVIFRKQLRRGFLPIFALMIAIGCGVAFGVFDNAISHYTDRGIEETGRGKVLFPAIRRIAESPLYGVGMSNTATKSDDGELRQPHDSLLFFGLAAGVLTLFSFLASIASAYRIALRMPESHQYAPFFLPLLVYSTFFLLVHDSIFMYPWFITAFAICQLERRRRRNPTWQNSLAKARIQGFAPRGV